MTNEIVAFQPATLDDVQRTAQLLAASNYFDAKGDPVMQIAQLSTKIH